MKYKWNIIYFKYSLSINSMKFTDFPNSFNLEYWVKEIFTYSYYTLECMKKLNNKRIIKEVGKEEINLNQQQFEYNLKMLNIINNDKFDIIKYIKFYYLSKDVNIIKQVFQ